MCGIAGYIGSQKIDERLIEHTLALMKNRGPDDQGRRVILEEQRTVCLLHSRLKIIDLDARANQPFQIGPISIIFNGEIYNYVELRRRLEQQGVVFQTSSDTEVLGQAYIRWQEHCVEYFEGMWSFVIYDASKRSVFMSRDRFGEKPLYMLQAPDGLYFGSEIKLIKSLCRNALSINTGHLARYLVNGYKALYKTSETFYENVKEFPAACAMMIDAQGDQRVWRYWRARVKDVPMTMTDAVEGFRERLIESLRLRLRSDVPVAFCLSGGVDSAALVSLAAKTLNYQVAAYSLIDSDERYNEYENIKATVDDVKCQHRMIHVTTDNTIERLGQLVRYHDAPVYTISYYIHSFLSQAIAADGFRVVCSGTGADELMTGYYDHYNFYLYEMCRKANFQKALADWQTYVQPVVRNPYLRRPNVFIDNALMRDHIYLNQNEFARCLKDQFDEPFSEKRYTPSVLRNRMMNELFEESVPVILHEDDLNSMMFSIENRSPYLDTGLFDFAYSIPVEHLIHDGYNKYILRESVKGILNDRVRLDRQKKGFNASIHSILDLDDPGTLSFLLDDGPIFDLVRKEHLEKMLGSARPFSNSYSKFLFSFINARIFLDLNSKVVHDCHC